MTTTLASDPVFSNNYATPIASSPVTPPLPLSVFTGQQQGFKTVNWSITPSTKYPLDCNCPNPGAVVDPLLKQGSAVIQLIAPGSRLPPRLNQFDIGMRKVFHIREKYTLMGEVQIFNVINTSAVLTESQTLGTTVKPYLAGGPGGQPSVILNPRMLRLNLQFKF